MFENRGYIWIEFILCTRGIHEGKGQQRAFDVRVAAPTAYTPSSVCRLATRRRPTRRALHNLQGCAVCADSPRDAHSLWQDKRWWMCYYVPNSRAACTLRLSTTRPISVPAASLRHSCSLFLRLALSTVIGRVAPHAQRRRPAAHIADLSLLTS